MILPEWVQPILIGIDVFVIFYGIRVAFTEKKRWGWFLALAFMFFLVKEVMSYNGVNVSFAVSLLLSVAGLASALGAFYLLMKDLPS